MLKFFNKHPKLIWAIMIAAIVVAVLSYFQRQEYMKNPFANQIGNPERSSESFQDTFYADQLSEKETTALQALTEAILSMQGGIFTFPEPLNGEEYTRVTFALDCGEQDLFYAMVDVPMTAQNQNINYINKNPLNIKDSIITKCILFLYPAEGLNIRGQIDKQGYVTNLEELAEPLQKMDPEKVRAVLSLKEQSESVLDAVVASLPKGAGEKDAIDFFLQWMDDNLKYDSEMMSGSVKLTTMTDVFERAAFEGHRSCAALEDRLSMANGYSKILTYLCNHAGIPAHVVMGNWKGTTAYTMVQVKFNDTVVFIDAAKAKAKDLWEQRYISDTLCSRYLTFPSYFTSVN